MTPILPGWSREKLFNQAWVDDLQPVAEKLMNAVIEIFYQSTGELEYDFETGEYTSVGTREVLYTGPARVQPIRMARNVPNNASDTEMQSVRFQVSALDIEVRPKHRIRVLESDLNETLTRFEYIVQGVMNSSNPFETTIETQVDTEIEVSPVDTDTENGG